jgi:hypothetical protein
MVTRYELTPPTVRQRAGAAVITTVAAVGGAVIAGIPAAVFIIVTGDRSSLDMTAVGGGFVSSGTDVASNPVLWGLADLGVVLVAALLATRLGRGAVGDTVFDIAAVDRAGNPARRWQIILNALLPMLIWTVTRVQVGSGRAVLFVLALWIPALISSQRRSIYSMLTGTYYQVHAPVKEVKRGWEGHGRSATDGRDLLS